ncbi:MAG TPA: Crp/Fnr family transcriptional regulator [Flavitalea sp.]|nr:Crp/Fnr family transcriptional regulator [Flavitalea sp.]
MADVSCDLKSCFLCTNCSPSWKALIAVKKTTHLFKRGKRVFVEGDPVSGIYFMNTGSVKISKNWGGEKDIILRFAIAGDVLGHRGFGGEPVYPVTATALEDSIACFIDNELLESTLMTNISFTYQLMQEYAKELLRAEHRMWDLAHRDVKDRIILALFEIADAFGSMDNDFISIPITRQDIAAYAGTSYETVFKLFAELSAKNKLTTLGKHIKINDRPALEGMLNKENYLSRLELTGTKY